MFRKFQQVGAYQRFNEARLIVRGLPEARAVQEQIRRQELNQEDIGIIRVDQR